MNLKTFNQVFTIMLLFGGLFITSCDENEEPDIDFNQLTTKALSDFVNVVANPLYADFESLSLQLKSDVEALTANPTAANLEKARNSWKSIRVVWEQSEGFLIGPVDENNYDPYLDTWPTDYNAMDNLMASTTPITLNYLAGLDDPDSEAELTLRGFHPLEYLLWGLSGNKLYSEITARQKEYMVALAGDINNNVSKLKASWLPGPTYYGNEIVNAGKSGSIYDSKKDALEEIANALIGICVEVGEGKMLDPFSPSPDSTITESPYAHNSFTDFKNNIIGARNVYTCTYKSTTGKSLSDIVKANNAALDLEIKSKFDLAINSFNGFTTSFEQAIYKDRPKVQNTIDALTSLQETIDIKLIAYLQQYVKD